MVNDSDIASRLSVITPYKRPRGVLCESVGTIGGSSSKTELMSENIDWIVSWSEIGKSVGKLINIIYMVGKQRNITPNRMI